MQYGGRRHFENRIFPYLSGSSSKFDEIWYANAAEETRQIYKSEINIKRANIILLKTTKFKSNVLESYPLANYHTRV